MRPAVRIAALVAVFVGGLTVASAASLGTVTAAGVAGFTGSSGSGAPTVYSYDGFTGSDNTDLSGRALAVGGTWTVAGSTWKITGNKAEGNSKGLNRMITNAGQANVRVLATITTTSGGSRKVGLVIRSDATATNYLFVHTDSGGGGKLLIEKRVGGSTTTLATLTPVTLAVPASLVVTANGSTIVATYEGVYTLSHTLSVTDQTLFGLQTYHGVVNDNSGVVTFDDFRIESP